MKKLFKLYDMCRQSKSNFWIVVIRFIYYKLFYGKSLLLHERVRISGVKNILQADGILEIGLKYRGFSDPRTNTWLNIKGTLFLNGSTSIGRGCDITIEKDASVTIGVNSYINCNTRIIISHYLQIGDNCAIAWDCQFLDDDFHNIDYPNKRGQYHGIHIFSNVWIGCGVKVYKGTTIPLGCVIASDSIVKRIFTEENCLIGGNPAKVLKHDVKWS